MDYYTEISEGYDNLHKEEQLKKLKIIKKYFTPKPPLLDIGAGTGISTEFFKIDAIALDPSEGMLSKYKGKKVIASAENLPFPDKTFNSIISITALHHINNIDQAIKEIKRVSKEDCTYAFSILKKAKNFNELRKKLNENFNLKEINEEKDLILVSQTY